MIEIPLSKTGKHAGKYVTIVDDIDADLAELNWSICRGAYTQYAIRTKRTSGKKVVIPLHRIVLERVLNRPLLKKEDVDHINGNGLDNRRENLRLASRTLNQANKRIQRNNTSGFKGVTWYKQQSKWGGQIINNGKHYFLGLFDTPEAAHAAYCEKAKELFGEFARFE